MFILSLSLDSVLPRQGLWVQPLVGELRSHVLHREAKTNKQKKKTNKQKTKLAYAAQLE